MPKTKLALTEPESFDSAIEAMKVKNILPTTLSSAELMKLKPEVRERALFSARTANAGYLTEMDKVINRILNPEQVTVNGKTVTVGLDMATARLQLKDALDSISYKPEPDEKGSITDLSSDARLNLILKTQTGLARGYGYWKDGQSSAVLDQWPCQELVRGEDRMEPRDWPQRWQEAGGTFYEGESDYPEGRMIARKDDPIWEAISAFGLPYPPFDFNSGMVLSDVSRSEAIELGIVDGDDVIEPQDRNFDEDLKASTEGMDEKMQQAMLESLGPDYDIDDEGVLGNAFNPDQARDENGRWTAVGGAGKQDAPKKGKATLADVLGSAAPAVASKPEYAMKHRPREDGPRAHNLLETDLAPRDIYERPDLYTGDPDSVGFKESVKALKAIAGKPDADVMIYRAAPKNELNRGDWVTLSPTYAKQHGMADDPSNDVPVHGFKVKAKDIRWAGDTVEEFGYYPKQYDSGFAPKSLLPPQQPRPFPPEKLSPDSHRFQNTTDAGPKTLNGVPFKADNEFNAANVPDKPLHEPQMMELLPHEHAASGVFIMEPDGRVWMYEPKGGFGG